MTEYALKRDLQIENTIQITESSTKETRKQFDQTLSYIKKAKQPIALITDTVDRLQRSFRETPLMDEMRKQGKLELHFLREGLIVEPTSTVFQTMSRRFLDKFKFRNQITTLIEADILKFFHKKRNHSEENR